MVPVILLFLAALPVFAAPEDKDLVQSGDDDYSDRIIGGRAAGIEEFPFLVGLVYTRICGGTIVQNSLCGGTIITKHWVLTSATCTCRMTTPSGEKVRLTHVRAGTSYSNGGGIMRHVLQKVAYNYPPHYTALVKVKKPWPLNGVTISIARLPRQDAPIPVNKLATIVGWGSKDIGGRLPCILSKQVVRVISVESCYNRVSYWSEINARVPDYIICTSSEPMWKTSSVSEADVGGPVVVEGEVVGIVSWFDSDNPTKVPNVHTRVSSYINWIEEIVGPLPRGCRDCFPPFRPACPYTSTGEHYVGPLPCGCRDRFPPFTPACPPTYTG